MSSASQTIPDTPSKPSAAAKSRTPLPGGPNDTHNTTAPPKQDPPQASLGETQMPESQMSSSITTSGSDPAPVSKPAEVNSQSRREIEQSSDTYEDEEEEEEEEESVLTEFEWGQFERRYTEVLKQHFKEECEIIEEFELYATSFIVWAQAAAQRDNARMSKRLKTRKEFTQLAESSLEDKKKHYLGVLDAFQKAMDMLRQQ